MREYGKGAPSGNVHKVLPAELLTDRRGRSIVRPDPLHAEITEYMYMLLCMYGVQYSVLNTAAAGDEIQLGSYPKRAGTTSYRVLCTEYGGVRSNMPTGKTTLTEYVPGEDGAFRR